MELSLCLCVQSSPERQGGGCSFRSGAVHTLLPREAFGDYRVLPGARLNQLRTDLCFLETLSGPCRTHRVALRRLSLHGYLTHETPPPRRTLQDAGAQGPVVVPGDRWFLMGEVTLYSLLEGQYCSHQFGPSRSSSFQHRRTLDIGSLLYRGTPLIIKYPFLGPYSSPMHRALWWSWGAGDFLWLRYPCS